MVNSRLKTVDCRLKIGLLFGLLALCFYRASSQQPAVTARPDSSRYLIGEWIHVSVEAKIPPNVESIAPAVKDSIGSFEILKVVAPEGEARVWDFTLTTFDSGKVYLPPIDFAYRVRGDTSVRIAQSNSLIFDVGSVAVDPKGEIRDIKLPMSAPWLFEDYLPYLLVLVALLLGGLGYYYWRRKQKQKELLTELAKPRIPPHQQALFELRELEDKKLWQQGKIKQYYSEVTEIIRRFFEGRWGIVALELTSDEILQQMKSIPDARKVWHQLQQFFTTADLVKFAKYLPTPDEHAQELRWAYEIVRAMEPRVVAAKEEIEYAG